MHRYEELEKLYYKRKIKKYVSIFFVLAVAVTIVIVISNFINKSENQPKKIFKSVKFKSSQEFNESKKNNAKEVVKNDLNVTKTKKSVILKKSDEKNETNKIDTSKSNLSFSFYIPNIKQEQKKDKIKKVQKQKKEIKNTDIKKPNVTVNEIKETNINVKSLIKEFNKHPDFNLAILISKYYYNKKDLANAKLWALKANNINPSDYRSWKMFALILLKKNDKIKAKEVLKIYLNDYGENEEIEKLLRSIDE